VALDPNVLQPEAAWLEQHPEAISVTVNIPKMDGPNAVEWQLAGQALTLEVPLASRVAAVKEMIRDALGGSIPLNKFQIKEKVRGFLKVRRRRKRVGGACARGGRVLTC
jgi:hypothetical protein